MRFYEIGEKAWELARTAFTTMRKHEIAPVPQNFALWYAYSTGAYPELTRTIDGMLREGAALGTAENDSLFERFFGIDGVVEEVREASTRIEANVNKVVEFLAQAGNDASAYGNRIDGLSGELGRTSSAEQIKALVQAILGETREMVTRSRNIEQRLGESSNEIAELRKRLETATREALTDPLTGFANRKSFDQRLRETMAQADETDTPLCLLMADIDHFKKFNDTFGHRVGDEVLRIVARTFKDSVKGRDLLARYGGEEFAVILPETPLHGALTVAESIRQTLASRRVVSKLSGTSLGTVTISIGAARYRAGETAHAFIQRADEALYAAKRAGRNRVEAEAAKVETLGAA